MTDDFPIRIRNAAAEDIPDILAIYNRSVVTETASFDLEPVSLENRLDWLSAHVGQFPVRIAEVQGQVIGYASLSRYNPKPAYDIAAELSIYVAEEHRGRGVANALADDILGIARESPLRTVVSLVTSENEASLRLHARLEFREVGVLHRCGVKFGRILDVVLFEKSVEGPDQAL